MDMGLDTGTSTGRLILNVVAAIGQFEREVMLERQKEGIARAKQLGKYKGRVPTARRKAKALVSLRREGLKPQEIATRLGIGRPVYTLRTTASGLLIGLERTLSVCLPRQIE
jgi:DNA invertase Pin-like site-specific DNA recombinase